MSGPTSVPAPAVAQAARAAVRAEGGRRGPRWKNIAVHGLLILACVIAAFPILRVLSVALRPGNTHPAERARADPAGRHPRIRSSTS